MALRVTPVPIPNTKVKPYRADGTAGAALWKSRSLPDLGQLAQSVEQRTENPRVPGSIPLGVTIVCRCGGIGRRTRLRI